MEWLCCSYLAVAFIYTNNMTLMVTPDRWVEYFSHVGGTFLNMGEPTLIPRYLHFVLASAAVGGLFSAVLWRIRQSRGGVSAEDAGRRIASGMTWFSYATMIQVLIGFWFLIALPKEIMLLFMGEGGIHTFLLVIGLAMALLTLLFGFKQRVYSTVASLVALVIVMAVMRALVRNAYLQPYFSLSHLKVMAQYSPMIMFLVVFVVGLALVAYMLRLTFRARTEG